jgi:uncharacterized protein (TIGR01777 family)
VTLRVAVVGATGQIGRPLCRELRAAGHAVSVVSRNPDRAAQLVEGASDYVAWDPASARFCGLIAASDAVVYLAGASVFDGKRHSRQDVEAESRARMAALDQLVSAAGGLSRRPATLVAASSAGYYGYAGHSDAKVVESTPAGTDWWGRGSADIERAARTARSYGIRTVLLRTGYVLTAQSLAGQVAQFRRHTGGWIGTGRGWTPWIHVTDAAGLIRFALEHPAIDGPLNLTAPAPVTGREFAATLGRALGSRAWLPVPTPMVRMGLGVVTDIIVRGKRVVPAAATAAGYQFRLPGLEAALRDLTAPASTAPPAGQAAGQEAGQEAGQAEGRAQ